MDDQTAVFLRHRDLLFAVAYNMLGSVADAEPDPRLRRPSRRHGHDR